ncbi:MAG: hypothetical protein NTX57_12295 [Armatimonadetes bacterium]|nr:hypothetical protein [Armatimonadota bacterium]
MSTETPDPSVGTPLESGVAAADAGDAIALDVCELAATLDPDEAIA